MTKMIVKNTRKKAPRNEFEKAAYEEYVTKGGMEYEPIIMPYVIEITYTPDFVDVENKVLIEDHHRLIWVRKAYPDWTLKIKLMTPNQKIRKGGKITYKQYAEKHGWIVI